MSRGKELLADFSDLRKAVKKRLAQLEKWKSQHDGGALSADKYLRRIKTLGVEISDLESILLKTIVNAEGGKARSSANPRRNRAA